MNFVANFLLGFAALWLMRYVAHKKACYTVVVIRPAEYKVRPQTCSKCHRTFYFLLQRRLKNDNEIIVVDGKLGKMEKFTLSDCPLSKDLFTRLLKNLN